MFGKLTVVLALFGGWALSAEQGPPAIAPDAQWAVDKANTIAYPDWLNAPGVRHELRSILSSEVGNLQYWIRCEKRAKGKIVVAVGEAFWSEPGHRIMDILIDGRVRASGIDPIKAAGGKHKLAAIVCDAEDLDGDGLLHLQIVPAKGSPDHVTLAAGIWWFANQDITVEQALAPFTNRAGGTPAPRPDLFICTFPGLAERQERLARLVETEDPALNAIVRNLYSDCVLSKLYDPQPPALPNKWFSPGGGYVGQWVWDTMFVAIAYAALDDDETIRGVFDNYWHTIDHNPEAPKGSPQYGMVPNFLKPWPPLGYSQIPILAWGCEMAWRQSGDRKLIERCLPYLVTFDEWYSTERDVDGDGLIEFGAYKPVGNAGMVQTARYETFDFHPPMDAMKLTKHPTRATGGEWYGNVEGVEQTCFLLMSEESIVRMARELGQSALADRYEKTIARRIQAIQEKMWDPKTQFFHSLDRDTHAKIADRTIQGFLTLACGAATREQAAALVKQLQNPKQWWPAYPVPTVAMDDPKFGAVAMWRGDMWPATTYLVALGLNRYGYCDVARELTHRMRRLIAEKGINERYNPLTGQPIGVAGLGMTCSAWTMMVQNLYGVQDDFRTIRVPPDAAGRRLKLGKLEVAHPQDGVVELRTAFERRFRVLFPGPARLEPPTVACDGQPLPAGEVAIENGFVGFTAHTGSLYRISR